MMYTYKVESYMECENSLYTNTEYYPKCVNKRESKVQYKINIMTCLKKSRRKRYVCVCLNIHTNKSVSERIYKKLRTLGWLPKGGEEGSLRMKGGKETLYNKYLYLLNLYHINIYLFNKY